MGHVLDAMRRNMALRGRTLEIRRLPGAGIVAARVTLKGFPRTFRPDEIEGAIVQGDWRVLFLADDLAEFGEPGRGCIVVDNQRQGTVQASERLLDGEYLAGYALHVKGNR